jgi:hypothetical protein
MIVSIPVANLIQGVSQQPPQMRLASQGSEQLNAYSSPTDGLTKRPPTKFQCPLEASPNNSNQTRFHFIERDTTERYILKINNNQVPTVYDLNGTSYSVGWGGVYGANTLSSWTSYMAGSGYIGSDCLSVADYTFIVNKTKNVAMTAATTTTRVDEALVTVVQANYKTNYIITMKDSSNMVKTFSVATYSGSGTAPAGEVGTIKTDDTATTLTAAINAASGQWTPGLSFTAVRYGSTIHIFGTGTSKFTVKATDSGGDSFLIACKDTVPRLSDLPVQAPADFVIAVNPDPEVKGNTYYVKFTAATADANGIWTECVAPGVTYVLDKTTTPFVMKRMSDTTNGIWFSIEEGPWANRTVGDTTTAKSPSFVGRTIQDIFFFKNRLGFLAGDKVCMSEAGAYFNFFKTSVAQTIDSDPIDVGTLSTSVSTLNKAVAQGDRLLLFGDKAQFVLGTSDNSPLTPTSVTSTLTTEYSNASASCPPVATGKTILFAQADSKYCGIREYYKTSMSSTMDQYEGLDLTANVNSYIEKTPRKIAVSSYDNLAVVLTDTGYDGSQIESETGAVLYSYKWMMNGSDKIQSAWSKWVFPKTKSIKAIHWINKKLYMVVDRNSKYQVEVMDFEVKVPDPATFIPHLDCYTHLTNTTYSGGVSSASTSVDMQWVSNLTAVYKGKLSNITSVSGVTVTSNINWTGGGETYVGIPYDMKYTFSPIYLRNQNVPVLDGRLSLTYGSITFADTGFFSVSITPTFRDSYAYLRDEKTYEYFGGGVSAAYYTDTVNLPTGTFRFPIHSKNDDVTVSVSNNSHMPIRLNSAVFEAHYVTRSRG